MSPRTEELLYVLLWSTEMLFRPTFRNLTDSFDDWAWRNRLTRRLAHLEQSKLLEAPAEPTSLERLIRLTEAGRKAAWGGRDPVAEWARPWDGRWRLVLFDVPVTEGGLRQRLRRALRQAHFGCVQQSVWVTPHSASAVRELVGLGRIDAQSLLLLEGQPAAGESDEEIVRAAWNFSEINRRYEQYLRWLQPPPARRNGLPEWCRRERARWQHAMSADPLLPSVLLPPDYRGAEACARRTAVLRHAFASSKLD